MGPWDDLPASPAAVTIRGFDVAIRLSCVGRLGEIERDGRLKTTDYALLIRRDRALTQACCTGPCFRASSLDAC